MPVVEFRGEAFDTSSPEKKYAAWDRIYWELRAMDEMEMRAEIDVLVHAAGADVSDLAKQLCMNWDELRELSKDPLVTIGNHTVSHYMLAKHPEEVAHAEIEDAQARLTRELNIVPKHLAYPVGDPTSAGPREFRVAQELGFTSALTTRLGVLYPKHKKHMRALPRVSLNGHYQERKYIELFVSGLPFAINNRFRRINVR